MKILVCGDQIIDVGRWTTATRLCPEAPAPVLIEQSVTHTQGGAGLVAEQLKALLGDESVLFEFGSRSRKERIFADGRLMCRIDYDSLPANEWDWDQFPDFETRVIRAIENEVPSVLIISDYAKKSFTEEIAGNIVRFANQIDCKVLVDAKHNWGWYRGCFAVFPNQREANFYPQGNSCNVIQKLGPEGCSVNGQLVPMEEKHAVSDVTGAGDVFIAAFAARLSRLLEAANGTKLNQYHLINCAKFANKVAGKSVEFLGTKVIEGEIP